MLRSGHYYRGRGVHLRKSHSRQHGVFAALHRIICAVNNLSEITTKCLLYDSPDRF